MSTSIYGKKQKQPGASNAFSDALIADSSTQAPDAGGGEGTKLGGADYANIATGAYSMIQGLTNKKPKAYKPNAFIPSVRPAQGDTEAMNRQKNEVAREASAATRDVTRIAGSDVNTGIAARLGIQANATKANMDAEAANAKLYREDQIRQDNQINQAKQLNNEIENQAKQINFGVDQNNYQNTRNSAISGVNSALQYEASRSADIRSKQAAEISGNQTLSAVDQGIFMDLYAKALVGPAKGDTDMARRIAEEGLAASKKSGNSFSSNFYGTRSAK